MTLKTPSPLTPDISNAMIRSIMVALDVIFKASGTDIRVHGRENVPDQPVLYVANHFTRMETILLPYVIKKYISKYPLSLADASLFVGGLGDIMTRGGAVSTTNPNRDKMLVRALLTDSHPVVIFPEGMMIKDKKIIEKGKYLINTATGKRPPHTGAGRLALRAEFLREQLRLMRERNDAAGIAAITSHFEIDPASLDAILGKHTLIVPVNITYYPVRAKDNAISRLVNRFVHDVSARMKEEMQVEGSMVMDGVDMDINFGKAISVSDYLTQSKGVADMIRDPGLYLDPSELKHAGPFKKIYIEMMYDYMRAIYAMTTVNLDHLASYLLSKYRKNTLREKDFKSRLYLAIDQLMRSGVTRYHKTLNCEQQHLLCDDVHEKYEQFISDLLADGLLARKNGVLTKNTGRFSQPHEFHSIRQDNIVYVLKNEIEPLAPLTQALNRLMWLPSFYIRRHLRKKFLSLDECLFEDDYHRHSAGGETKPITIGRPFFRHHFWHTRGVILIHGYLAAPEEIRPLADFLYRHGFSVYGARLSGHGTSPEDLSHQHWPDWYESVNRAYIVMNHSVRCFVVAGFSTGAGLALLQAANKPGHLQGVISINAPARLQNTSARYSPLIVGWNKLLGALRVQKGKMEYIANDPENPHINYTRNPVSGVNELEKLMKRVKARLPEIHIPALVIQGSADPVVNPASGEDIYSRLGSPNKQLVQIAANHHGILRGVESGDVQEKVLAFLRKVFAN